MKRILPWLIATAGLLFGASRIQWGPQVTPTGGCCWHGHITNGVMA